MRRSIRCLKHTTRGLSNLILLYLAGEQARSGLGKAPRGYQDPSASSELLELPQGVRRYAFHSRKDDNPVLVSSQRQSVLFDAADLLEHLVVEEVQLIS